MILAAAIAVALSVATLLAALPPSTFKVGANFPEENNYNALAELKGTKYQYDLRRFYGARSSKETAQIKSWVDMDEKDASARSERFNALLMLDFGVCALFIAVAIGLWLTKLVKKLPRAALEAAARGKNLYDDAIQVGRRTVRAVDERAKELKAPPES